MSNITKTNKVPVTLVSGWLGAGKTTLVEHLLRNTEGKKIGILVNDMAGINIDANILSQVIVHKGDMVELSNGCICCSLRKDFVEQLAQLAAEHVNYGKNNMGLASSVSRRFDYIVVESSGISEPQQVAEAFDLPLDDEETSTVKGNTHLFDSPEEKEEYENNVLLQKSIRLLQEHAYLDTTVSVVDAFHFLKDVRTSTDSLSDLGQANDDNDTRVLSELLIEQIEFADVLIINKIDLVSSSSRLKQLQAFLSVMNPTARQYLCQNSKIDPHCILGTSLFSMEKARHSAGWLQSLQGNHIPESIEYGITNLVFRANRPFHPARFHRLLFGDDGDTDVDDNDTKNPSSTVQTTSSLGGNSATRTSERSVPTRQVPGGTTNVLSTSDHGIGNEENTHEKDGFLKNHPLYGLIRSKGVAWLATEKGHSFTLQIAQVGLMWNFSFGQPWYDALTTDDWNNLHEDDKVSIRCMFSNEIGVGDRKQEIVFIGVHMDTQKVQEAFEKALVTADEWTTYLHAFNIAQEPGYVTGNTDDPLSTTITTSRNHAKGKTKGGKRSSPFTVRKPTKTMRKKALHRLRSAAWLGDWNDDDDEEEEEEEDELMKEENDEEGKDGDEK